VHQADGLLRIPAAVVLDTLHQGTGAIADTYDRDPDSFPHLGLVTDWSCRYGNLQGGGLFVATCPPAFSLA
jgi:hypothetical protein